MSSTFAKDTFKICVGQICQNIGWHAVQSSPMDILVDVLHKYVLELSKSVHQYSIQYNRTEPNLDDLALAFKDMGVSLHDMEEYVNNVEPVPFPRKVPAFPVRVAARLAIPRPDSRELALRPEHIPEYLPLMRPDLEEEEAAFSQTAPDGTKKPGPETNPGGDSPSPFGSPGHAPKRTGEWSESPNKKLRYYSEEEGRPMREVTSVFMTPSGFVSPIHEGKTAEASLPCLVDSPPPTPEHPSHSKKEIKSKDKARPKKDKDGGKKDVKKLKSMKKENKENSVKHDKALTSSSSSKKEHAHKSRSEKGEAPKKSKGDKSRLKRKDEFHRMKENFKISKLKSKMKHTSASSSIGMKSSKISKKIKSGKLSKLPKSFKIEKTKAIQPPPSPPASPLPPTAVMPSPVKEVIETGPEPDEELLMMVSDVEVKEEKPEELLYREESPEPRLVIDDSIETQARQERESRLEVIDEVIEAVIRRGEEESEVEVEKNKKAMDDTINSVIRGPPLVKKLEPKDIYDFTDTSDSSSLSSSDLQPHSPIHVPVKKELSPKKSTNLKDKSKKHSPKDAKSKPPNPNISSKFLLKVEERTPSPVSLKEDLLSSDGSTPPMSPQRNTFFDPMPNHLHPTPLLSHVPPPLLSTALPPPFIPGFSSSPFAPMRSLQTNPHFPTPPLFTHPKSESSFQNVQPLNLAKSGPSSQKASPEKSDPEPMSPEPEATDLLKKAAVITDRLKMKEHKKEKQKKKGRKETAKLKEKKEADRKEKERKEMEKKEREKKEAEKKEKERKEEVKEKKEKEEVKEKAKLKDKPKVKAERNIKVEKRKLKPEKKKGKEKEEKAKEDSAVPKMTLKWTGTPGSTKISASEEEEVLAAVPAPPPREPTPPPPIVEPAPPAALSEPKLPHRGRGRGKKAPSMPPPARTVITETLGTIVDESGNKIWICPACSRADDGSPMIGCDECDDWYHWVCVNIVVPPKEEENWFCVRCIAKRQGASAKRRKRKHKKDK